MRLNERRLMQLRTMPYSEYLKTPEWAEKREEALERDDNRCRLCNTSLDLQVHHRTYANRGNEEVEDLTTLCKSCHEHFHKRIAQADIMGRTGVDYSSPRRREVGQHTWEEYLVGMLTLHPGVMLHVRGILTGEDFSNDEARALYLFLDEALSQEQPVTPIEQYIPAQLLPVAERAIQSYSEKPSENVDPTKLIQEAIGASTRIKRTRLIRLNGELQAQINDATSAGDTETVRALLPRLMAIQHQLRTIYSATHITW